MKTNEPTENPCFNLNNASVDKLDVNKLLDLLIAKDEQIRKDREQIYKLIRIIENCLKVMPDSTYTPCKKMPVWYN